MATTSRSRSPNSAWHYESVHSKGSSYRPCLGGCGATIPAYGGKERCPECAYVREMQIKRRSDAKRREKKKLKEYVGPVCDRKRHLVCHPYSVDALHNTASALNLSRAWFHAGKHPHYDIPINRVKEITEKCVVVSSRFIVYLINSALTNTTP